ncbi:uncharacterized protein LOC111307426 [Durio zibethinus]|uniref:Uncharacterized protein LOC111307426 n=1 Tax=Durio zibethinus TaxID=66656 RepID=A0A6P6A8E0_DURZI|nr:uncharacterized protein LOC111307426 [Durio zibethinus]
MEELREIAKAYLDAASLDMQKEAQNFFNEMDSNLDGKVSLQEFLDFMREEQYQELRSSDLFKQLCRGNSETLEFMDVMTLYYIIRSGRPFCDACNQFIKDTYFCCTKCFHSSNENYRLCFQCFQGKKYITGSQSHRHQFVDNFTLLELKRKDALKGAAVSNKGKRERMKAKLKAIEKTLIAGSSKGTTSDCAMQ